MLCDPYFGDSEKEIQIISMNGGNFGAAPIPPAFKKNQPENIELEKLKLKRLTNRV
jgi:hypothetical protein